MTEPLAVAAVGFCGGLLLGGFFFAGLWWTVRRGVSSRQAAVWFAASYLVRVGLLATGLYFLAHDNAARGLAACVGVIVARIAVARLGSSASAGTVAGGNAQ
jgi:F1F0 ATPase subunit 2